MPTPSSATTATDAGNKKGETTTPAQRLFFAACSGVGATLVVHPLDVTRFRMQLDAEGGSSRQFQNSLQAARHIVKTEGATGLYAGLSAGVFRQLAYGMPRMALYPMLLERFATPGQPLPFWKKLALGCLAGGAAATIGVPSEVCLVRMGSDSKLPPSERRGYKHVGDALIRIAREEGVAQLWAGTGPTVARACLLNAGQLGVYSEAKEALVKHAGMVPGSIPLQLVASFASAITAVALSCPADVLKTRLQQQKPGQYSGLVDCAATLLRTEGVFAFWKGAGPSIIKLAPHSVISLLILDNLTYWFTGKSAM